MRIAAAMAVGGIIQAHCAQTGLEAAKSHIP
jgi:hypothetical protein